MSTTQPEHSSSPLPAQPLARQRPGRLRSVLGLLFASRVATVGFCLVSFWVVVGLF